MFNDLLETRKRARRHRFEAKRIEVIHFEDEMTEDERLIAEDKRDSDLYDLNTCHER